MGGLVLQTGGRVSTTRQSTSLFPIVQWQDARLLTGQSRFESWSGSHFLGPSSNWTGYDPFKIVMRDRGPPALPICARSSTG